MQWNEKIHNRVMKQIRAWEYRKNHIAGIQLDFDASTKSLNKYEQFLRKVRLLIPQHYQLSVTGLLDWSNNGDPKAIASVEDVVDEVIFQTYQGRKTIPHYHAYMNSMLKLHIPFKIGVVERGNWNRGYETLFAQSEYYRGVVVFLLPNK
jgi:hypothetical protein